VLELRVGLGEDERHDGETSGFVGLEKEQARSAVRSRKAHPNGIGQSSESGSIGSVPTV
jgi:hypothetical protein